MKEIRTSDKFEILYKPEKAVFSSHRLTFIPALPDFEPKKIQQEEAMRYLARIFPDNEIVSILKNEVEFIDSGSAFESVNCNNCGRQVDIEQWQQWMESAFANNFSDLRITTPCCGKATTLNDLYYQAPSGFSKYTLTVVNPEYHKTEQANTSLEQILGVMMKTIWAS